MDKKGVTLVELLVVVAILGILAAIVIPGYIGYQKKSARTEAFSNLENLRLLEEQFYAENGRYAPNPDATRTYNGTHGTEDDGIEDVLRGFKPGSAANLLFIYNLRTSNNGVNFTATATGKSGTRVAGETFTIDHNNNKNF